MNNSETNSLLRNFAQTSDANESEHALSALISDCAEPIVSKIIRYKTRGAIDEGEEIYSEVMLQLVGRLQKLRGETGENPIDDFDSYVSVTAYNACDRFLSRKYPQRRRLKNGLRYLLTHRQGFALWQDARGNYVGGFHRWQLAASGDNNSSLKMQNLRDDARAFGRDARVEKSWSEQKKAYELLTAIFNWTNAPVEIDAAQTGEKVETKAVIQIADTRPDVSRSAEQRAYLEKLWNEIAELPTRQRAAVLLNLKDETGRGAIDLWLVVGVTTIDKIAAVLEMTTEGLAILWNDLPLEDNRIAEILGLTRQQVINLRKSARERLARRLKGF